MTCGNGVGRSFWGLQDACPPVLRVQPDIATHSETCEHPRASIPYTNPKILKSIGAIESLLDLARLLLGLKLGDVNSSSSCPEYALSPFFPGLGSLISPF